MPQIPALLKDLDIKDCIVTVDAGNTRSSVAKEIINKGADYVMIVKKNEGSLHKKLENIFNGSFPEKFEFTDDEKTELNRGRIEYRRCVTADARQFDHLDILSKWPELKTIGYTEHVRVTSKNSTHQVRFFISSVEEEAAGHLQYIRDHWQVENKCHWVLDVAFGEDANRVKHKATSKHLALMRRMAMGLLKPFKEKEKKYSGSG